jgi:hypothetical protein
MIKTKQEQYRTPEYPTSTSSAALSHMAFHITILLLNNGGPPSSAVNAMVMLLVAATCLAHHTCCQSTARALLHAHAHQHC